MAAVLGIDAAWTPSEPSGVALIQGTGHSWRCVAVAPSYSSFVGLANGQTVDWSRRASGSEANAAVLLEAARRLLGEPVSLVTVDMPVSTVPFDTRRAADQAVSKKFWANWCSAHSPGPVRPGPLGFNLSRQFEALGLPVATSSTRPGTPFCLVEVYPHPALLTLLNRDRRVPYKISKAAKYWKGVAVRERIGLLAAEFANIRNALDEHIQGIPDFEQPINEATTLAALKPIEDVLDALICCWVGAEYLSANAYPLGDQTAAIWCPGSPIRELPAP